MIYGAAGDVNHRPKAVYEFEHLGFQPSEILGSEMNKDSPRSCEATNCGDLFP